MLVLIVVHIGHKCIDWFRLKSSNQVHPDPGFPIDLPMQEIILEPPNQDLRNSDVRSRFEPIIELNIVKFNPDMVNPMISLMTCLIPPLLLSLFFSNQLHYATYQILFHIVFCFYVPFLVCIFNSKLRTFIISHLKN